MAEPKVIPDVETVVVQWAKDDALLDVIHNGRVATNLPEDPFNQDSGTPITDPFITVFRVGGQPDRKFDGLIDRALIQIDCYGPPGGYRQASHAARTLVARAHIFVGSVAASGPDNLAWVFGYEIVTGPRRVHEPETNWARYIVEMFANVTSGEET